MERFKNSVVFIFVALVAPSLFGAGCTLNQEIEPAMEQPPLLAQRSGMPQVPASRPGGIGDPCFAAASSRNLRGI